MFPGSLLFPKKNPKQKIKQKMLKKMFEAQLIWMGLKFGRKGERGRKEEVIDIWFLLSATAVTLSFFPSFLLSFFLSHFLFLSFSPSLFPAGRCLKLTEISRSKVNLIKIDIDDKSCIVKERKSKKKKKLVEEKVKKQERKREKREERKKEGRKKKERKRKE